MAEDRACFGRRARLAALGYDTYLAYLRSERWAETRARYRRSRMPQTCRICGAATVDLHHRSYRRVGRERLQDLVPLCRDHHSALHELLRRVDRQDWYRVTGAFIRTERRQRRLDGLPFINTSGKLVTRRGRGP